MTKKRYLYQNVINDLQRKFVLLSGPRQVGKTTFAKDLPFHTTYLNYDEISHRMIIRNKEWPRDTQLLVLDELHKMKDWKRFLKGIYDVHGLLPPILVTGSARLDIAKKMGDSLAGRFHAWRMHPLCVKELLSLGVPPEESFSKILTLSGFPEPYFSNDREYYQRWATSHLDIIIRQDLIQLERVSDIASLETLLELLSNQVGALVSYESLARSLDRDAGTIKRWLTILENLFVIFKVTPWSRNIKKSLKKLPKYYFYDVARVKNGDPARFENVVACALLKELHYIHDAKGLKGNLHFLRSRDGHELDFLVEVQGQPRMIVETKWSETACSPHFSWFAPFFKGDSIDTYQVLAVPTVARESKQGTKIVSAPAWLAALSLYPSTSKGER
jgi:predicted AAA+ superfamily ATPase